MGAPPIAPKTLTAVALLLAAVCPAQQPGPAPTKPAPTSAQPSPADALAKRTREIIDGARATPVEIFADIILRKDLIGNLPKAEKIAALKEAFYRAGEARQPAPLRDFGRVFAPALAFVGVVGGNQAVADRVAAQNFMLDGLSIRCRAVQALLRIDPKAARELFDAIPRRPASKPDCSEGFVPDAGIYFETLAAVAASDAFTDEEKKKLAPWAMLESGARSASGAWETAAVARTLTRFARNEKDASSMESALAASLSVSDSDRSFSSALRQLSFVAVILDAREVLVKFGATGTPLLAALRAYLVRQLSGVRCEESPVAYSPRNNPIEDFNNALKGRTDIAPVSPDEIKAEKFDGRVEPGSGDYSNGAEFQALLKEVMEISRFSVLSTGRGVSFSWNGKPLDDTAVSNARQVLSRIEDWRGAPEQDPLEVFHQRCRLLRDMYGAPLDADAARVADGEALAALEDPAILSQAPPEWLTEFESIAAARRMHLVETSRGQPPGSPPAPGAFVPVPPAFVPAPPDPNLFRAIAGSKLLALSLYGQIELLEIEKRR